MSNDKVWSVKGRTFRHVRNDEVTTGTGLPRSNTSQPGKMRYVAENGKLKETKSFVLDRTRKGGKKLRKKPGSYDFTKYETPSENKQKLRKETDELVLQFLQNNLITVYNDGEAWKK